MKLTHFFVLLLLFSVSLFVFLKPQSYAQNSDENVPTLEIEDFTVYEINALGVKSVVSGTLGRQYTEHYEVENSHYIQNKNQLGEHLYSDFGVFKNDIVYLNDNVRYFREDGLSFESEHAVYNTKKEFLYVPKSFVLTQNENIIYGNELYYHSLTGDIKAQGVNANYYIQEKK